MPALPVWPSCLIWGTVPEVAWRGDASRLGEIARKLRCLGPPEGLRSRRFPLPVTTLRVRVPCLRDALREANLLALTYYFSIIYGISTKRVRRQSACPSGHYRPLGRASLLACANTLHSFRHAKRPPRETSRAKRPPRGHLWTPSHTTDARTVDVPHAKSTRAVNKERRPPGQRLRGVDSGFPHAV